MRPVAALLLGLVSLGCSHAGLAQARESVRGDGDVVTRTRTVPAFRRVELSTALDLEVTEGPAQSVAVTIDGDLEPLVETRVEGDKLIVDSREPLRPRGSGRVTVTVPVLEALDLAGSGNVRIAGAEAPREVRLGLEGSGNLSWTGKAGKLRLELSGSGDVRLAGATDRLEVAITGSGDVDSGALRARDAALSIAGSGDIRAALDGGALSAAIDGSGDIDWTGTGQVVSAAVSGSGAIRHR